MNRHILDFLQTTRELLESDQVRMMGRWKHHGPISTLDHSLFVAYLSYRAAKVLGLDARAAARGGLLHDLYLYDPRTLPSYRQCFAHPVAAAENAAALCGGLTAREKNCILAHMWPLSRRAPRSREAAAVCLADKLCATAEIMQIWRNLGLRRAVLSGA